MQRPVWAVAAFFLLHCFSAALAQAGPYVNSTTGTFGNSNATRCANGGWLVRTIVVSDSFVIGDVNFGYRVSHPYRTDTNLQIQSPAGTVVNLLTGNYTSGWQNYNVLFDDEASVQVDTGSHQSNDNLALPNFSSVVRSEGNPLSNFDGQNALGTWTIRMCDVYAPADNGSFQRGQLFFTASGAELSAQKSTAIYDPGALGLFALPGNDLIYTIAVTNIGLGAADADSIVIMDALPAEMTFYNGDIDDAGPEVDPVQFTQSGAALSFTYGTDIRYSDATTRPANFAACAYTPLAGYDPNVTFVCINPKGAMLAGSPDPTFSVSFRMRIK